MAPPARPCWNDRTGPYRCNPSASVIAILVIAFVFTGGVDALGLLAAGASIGTVFALRALGVRKPVAYIPAGIALWLSLGAAGA